MTTPSFSILMPAFNPGRFLLPAVASAVEQMRSTDELIVQDGGSTDGSMRDLRTRYGGDSRVKIVSEPDRGQSHALQRALCRAVNPYVGWLNADDLYHPGALDAVRRALTDSDGGSAVDVVYGSSTIFDADDRTLRRTVPAEFSVGAFVRHGCHVFSGSVFLRTELLRVVGGFDEGLHFAMDFDLFFRVASSAERTVQLPEALGGLRWHPDSKSGSGQWRFFREAVHIRWGYARGIRQRAWVVGQMTYRLLGVPLLPLRISRLGSRLRGVKRFGR